MARTAARPRQVTIWFRGNPYLLDLVRCRRALVQRQVAGEIDSMGAVADAAGVDRSTVSRFFSGRTPSLTVSLKILEVLKLTFAEVFTPLAEDRS